MRNRTLKRLGDNFLSLLVLQFINYLLPLFLIPYLIRILGIEGFGIYSFILAIIMYGVQMSDYGFELSATYHISLHQNNPDKINEIFSSVLIIKLLIALFYLIFLTLLTYLIDKLFLYQELIFLTFGMLLGHILSPLWFFQGVEKMRYIMYLNGISKLFFTLAVFLVVKEDSDLYLLILLNTVITLIIGISSLYLAIKKFNIRVSFQSWNRLLFYLKEGWYIFTSKFAVEFYTTVNMILLGFFASPLIVGYYAVSVKIIHAIGSLLDPLTRTVYPYLVKVYKHSNKTYMARNRALSVVIFIIMTPIALLVGYFSDSILEIITGKEVMPLNIEILKLFSVTLIVYLYGSQFTNMLVTIKKTKILNKILFMTAGVNLLFAPLLLYFYGVMGMVLLSVFLAFFLTFSKGYYVFFYHNKIK
jgi:PST family polysaccharide transporter